MRVHIASGLTSPDRRTDLEERINFWLNMQKPKIITVTQSHPTPDEIVITIFYEE
jgi:hypothetical protein